mmetsp:Transcript_90651/g.252366  ORF Transcript_90651/g.252366 Transcript_90651/m.252366 type:complete len:290 (+) Transcript_90651:643-1512(+)
MFLMSSPLAATSVAHRTRASPLRNLLSAVSRLDWSRSPWISSVHKPKDLSLFNSQARFVQFFLVLLKTKQLPPSASCPKIRFKADILSSFELQISTLCVMFVFVVMSSEPIWICMGSLMYFLAKSRHSRGHVAVNIDICRSQGHLSSTCLICGSKPMSSMRSASSNTSVLTASRRTWPPSRKSLRRPGQATIMCTPARYLYIWSRFGAPPYIETALILRHRPKRLASSSVCCASSRVGDITKRPTPWRSGLQPVRIISLKAGRRKARVLPLPVAAMPMTSLPWMASGQV